jgi:phage terminase large subunit GpA-like protein
MNIPDQAYWIPIHSFLDGLRPTRNLSVRQWSEANRFLPTGVSARPGPFDAMVIPYGIEIMEALSPKSPYKRVIVIKGTQLGLSTIGENAIGCWMDIAPANIIYVMPNLSLAKRTSKTRIKSLVEDTPVLRYKVAKARSRDNSNTMLFKDFKGGSLIMMGAESPADASSINARYVYFDEISRYPVSLGVEGDVIATITKRTDTYDGNKKLYLTSTPTIEGSCAITREYDETDQRYYHIPCIHCNYYQVLTFEQFAWDAGIPSSVRYICENCGGEMRNHNKAQFLPKGKWIAKYPERSNSDTVGYHISGFYSPLGFYTWETMVAAYEKCLLKPQRMITFSQTVLGKAYKLEGEQPPAQQLFERGIASSYTMNTMPDEVCILTCGIDVQADRVECHVIGWGKGMRSWSIAYEVFTGDFGKQEVRGRLSQLINRHWRRGETDEALGIKLAFIDSGYHSSNVYEFCLSMGAKHVVPVKGGPDTMTTPLNPPKYVYTRKDGVKDKALMMILVNGSYFKTMLYGRLKMQVNEDRTLPQGYCSFPRDYDIGWYKQLTAEKRVPKENQSGFVKYQWQKPSGARNEVLDTTVYCMAAATQLGLDRYTDTEWDRLAPYKVGNGTISTKDTPRKPVAKSKPVAKNSLGMLNDLNPLS